MNTMNELKPVIYNHLLEWAGDNYTSVSADPRDSACMWTGTCCSEKICKRSEPSFYNSGRIFISLHCLKWIGSDCSCCSTSFQFWPSVKPSKDLEFVILVITIGPDWIFYWQKTTLQGELKINRALLFRSFFMFFPFFSSPFLWSLLCNWSFCYR